MDLAIVFVGYENTAESNVNALLDDFLDDKSTSIVMPQWSMAEKMPGLRHVENYLDGHDISYSRAIMYDDLMMMLKNIDADKRYLVVCGAENILDMITDAAGSGIPVLDLCEGLDDISWVANVHGGLGMPVENKPAHDHKPYHDPCPRDCPAHEWDGERHNAVIREEIHKELEVPVGAFNQVTMTDEELKAFMIGLIQTHEEGFHHGERVNIKSDDVVRRPDPEDSEKIRCYETEQGKIRKAGRSKIKTGEIEIFLTQEEINTRK